MSHHLRRPRRRRRPARLLNRAAHRLPFIRQPGRARPSTEPTPSQAPFHARGQGIEDGEQQKAGQPDQAAEAGHADREAQAADPDGSKETRPAQGRVAQDGAGIASGPVRGSAFRSRGELPVALVDGELRGASAAGGRPVGRRFAAPSPGGRPPRAVCDERSADRGAATVWVVGGISVLMVVMTAVLWFGAAVVTRHRAESAADLAALAAAAVAAGGERQACAEARWVVERMDTELASCRLSGWDALVEVRAPFEPFGSAAGRARAGPVELTR